MLSSNSSSRNPNYGPLSENDITSFTSKSEDPNFFFNFPYEDVLYLDHFLAADWSGNNMALDGVSLAVEHQPTAARRSLKKDRHSKINTARGPRDRRMRLSLDIARRFFDLQDLLGYDKASRTVDWLLKNSRSAIRDLQRGSTCTSEDGGEAASSSITAAAASSNRKLVGKRGVRVQVQQKRATVARESRRKARERARERTSQKRRLMRENTAQTHAFGEEARICGSTTGEGVLCQWNSFDFQNNINHEFLHQDEQIAEFEFNGKPWEGFNNFN